MFKLEKIKNCYNIVFLEKNPIIFEMGAPPMPITWKSEYDENGNQIVTSKNIYFADKIGYEQWQLEILLIKKFNGVKNSIFIDFNNKEDATNALEWIESIYIANKLK